MTYPNIYAAQVGPLALATLDANFLWATDIQSQAITANAGGTADAITATYIPAVTALVNGLTLYVRASASNATTTPQFSPNGLTARTIVKATGSLVVGDIAGAGHWLQLTYDTTLVAWVLSNPADTQGGNLQATSINGGQLAGFRNRIINGGCLVVQRSSPTLSTAYQYGQVDRHMFLCSGGTGVSGTIAQSGLSGTSTGFSAGVSASWTTGNFYMQHRIESWNTLDLGSKTITVSCKVYQNTGGTRNFKISLAKPTTTADTFSAQTTLYTSPTATAVPSGTATTVTATYTLGAVEALLGLAVYVFDSDAPNTVVSKLYLVGDLQLELGSVATPFEQRPYGMELALCQRYLPAFNSVSTASYLGPAQGTSATNTTCEINFLVPARVAPTSIAISSAAHFTVQGFSAVSALSLTGAVSTTGAVLSATITSGAAGYGVYLIFNNASGQLLFNGCEL